jgi:hypothetical protein
VEGWKRRFTHLVMEQIRVVAQLYHYQISASLDQPNDPHLKFVHEQIAASNTVKSPSWKTTFRTLRVYAPSTLHFRREISSLEFKTYERYELRTHGAI